MIRRLILSASLFTVMGLVSNPASACPIADAKEASQGDLPADATIARFSVAGMTCGSCALKIKKSVEGVAGVKLARVMMDGTMEVAFDSATTNIDAILTEARKAGKYTIEKA